VKGDLDSLGAAGTAEGARELAGRHLGEHLGELCPGPIQVARRDVIRSVEISNGVADHFVAPTKVPYAAAGGEIDVALGACAVQVAAIRADDLDLVGLRSAGEIGAIELDEVHRTTLRTRAPRVITGDRILQDFEE
jgi:hypothetical protein